LKDPSRSTWFVLSLALATACMFVAACHGGGGPAPPTATSTPPPTQTSTPLPPHIDTPLGPFVIAKVETEGQHGFYGAAPGHQILIVRFEPVGVVRSPESSLHILSGYGEGSYVTSADGGRWERISSTATAVEDELSLDFDFEVPAGTRTFTLYVPGNDPIALPEPTALATPTP